MRAAPRTASPDQLVADASAAFARAVSATGELTERRITVAGVPVRIRIAGATLADRLLPALPASTPDISPPRLVLEAFDGASGVGLPPSPWGPEDVLPGEEVRGAATGPLLAAIAPDHGTVSLLDGPRRHGIFFTRDAAAMPDWEDGSPLRHLLRWGLAENGLALLHAAAVGLPHGRGALLLGNGGAGKSTTALTCMEDGLDVAADDYCLVDEERRAHRLYGIAKLGARSLELLPGLAAHGGPLRGPQHKAHLSLHERYASSTSVDALILPRVANRTGPAREIPGGAAVREILASTLLQMPARRDATVAALFGLARSVPAYELPVGPDPSAVAAAVREVLAR